MKILPRNAILSLGGVTLAGCVLYTNLLANGRIQLTVALASLLIFQALYSRFFKIREPLQLALDICFVAGLIILTLNLLAQTIYRINWNHGFFFEPSYVTIIESRELLKGILFGHFRKVYTAMKGYPYLLTLYPPLFHGLVKVSSFFFGPTFFAARIISVASFIVLLGVIGVIVYRVTRTLFLAIMIVGVTLASAQITNWSVVGRPDMLAWMFAFCSVSILLPTSKGITPTRRGLAWAATAMCLALLTKEQTLPFFIGCSIYALIVYPNKREVIVWYVTPVAIVVGSFYLLLNVFTDGNFFLNVLAYPSMLASNNEFNKLSTLLTASKDLLITIYPVLLTFLIYAFLNLYKFKPDLLSIIFLVNLPFQVLLLRSWGADTNYTICFIIIVFCGTAGLTSFFKGKNLFLGASALMFSFLMMPYSNYSMLSDISTYRLNLPKPNNKISNHRMNQIVIATIFKNSKGIALVDAESSYLVLAHDKGNVRYIDAVESSVYANIGGWDPDHSLVALDIQKGKFAFIIVTKFMPQALKRAIAQVYAPILNVDNSTIYTIK